MNSPKNVTTDKQRRKPSVTRLLDNVSIRNKILLGFSTPILLILLVTSSNYTSTKTLIDSNKRVDHSYKVIANARLLERIIVDMESGERGFLITGKDVFLEPFIQAEKHWATSIGDLSTLVADNPKQVAAISEIDRLEKDWRKLAADPEIQQRRKVRPENVSLDYIQNILREKTGKRITDNIRATAQELNEVFIQASAKESENVLAKIVKDIVDQETGERGFLITGDDEFLEPYHQGEKNFRQHISQLRTLIFASPDHNQVRAILSEIESLHNNWHDTSAQTEMQLRHDHDQKAQSNDTDIQYYQRLESILSKDKGRDTLNNTRIKVKILEEIYSKSGNQKALLFIADLAKNIEDQETGIRGYLLTGKKEFLDPYYSGNIEFKSNLSLLQGLSAQTASIKDMLKYVDSIESSLKEWQTKAATKEISTRRTLNETERDSVRITQDYIINSDKEYVKLLDLIDETYQTFIKHGQKTPAGEMQHLKLAITTTKLSVINHLMAPDRYNADFIQSKASTLNQKMATILLSKDQWPDKVTRDLLQQIAKISDISNHWFQAITVLVTDFKNRHQDQSTTIKKIQNALQTGQGKDILDDIRITLDELDTEFVKSKNLQPSLLVISASKYIVDQETGQRGFLITGDENFLEPYIEGQKNFRETIAKLYNVANSHFDKHSVLDNILQIEKNIERWRSLTALPAIALRQKVNAGTALHQDIEAKVGEDIGKTALTSIRNIIRDSSREFRNSHSEYAANILTKILKDILNQETAIRGYLITGKEQFLEPYYRGEKAMQRHILELKNTVNATFDKDRVHALIDKVHKRSEQWLAEAGRPRIALRRKINQTGASMSDVTALIERETGKNIVDEIRQRLHTFIEAEENLISVRTEKADSAAKNTLTQTLFGSGFTILIALAMAIALSKTIIQRLSHLMDATKNVASGDFSTNVKIKGSDEIGKLSMSFNHMMEELQISTEIAEESRNELKAHAKVLFQKKSDVEKSNQELIIAHEQLAEQAEDLAQSSKYKSEFLASMSHEIRTPMNGVLGMLGLLKKDNLDASQRHKVLLAHSSAQSLLTLINDILDFSKIEANKLELEFLDFDLPSQLGDFAESAALKAHEKGLEFVLDIRGIRRGSVRGDPGRIRQILNNLVGNAIKFTQSGEVVLQATLEEAPGDNFLHMRCSIIDSGVGIAEDKLEHIFNSFTQEDASTTRQFGGTGLGLAIARQLSRLMGGDITVQSTLGRGSNFTFCIQLAPSEQIQCLPQVDISGHQILIVDDNPTNREVLQGQLELWGAQVKDVDSAERALLLLENCSDDELFELAFIDSDMPVTNGLELGAMIRQNSRYDSIKLIMMTSLAEQGDTKRFQEVGFNAYFPKPTTFGYLFGALSLLVQTEHSDVMDTSLLSDHHTRGIQDQDANELSINFDSNTRLLVVEDNPINQEVIRGLFDDYEINSSYAGNGQEALQALREAPRELPFSFVFMDCQMPEMDGFAATRAIREGKAGEHNRDITIVAMTANAMRGDRERCLAAGMNDYLSKPIQEHRVIDTLNKYLMPLTPVAIIAEPNLALSSPLSSPLNSPLSSSSTPSSSSSSASNNTSNSKIWDEDGFLRRVRNKPERALKLMNSFEKSVPADIEELKQAVMSENNLHVSEIAHKIRGIAGNLGAVQLAKCMAEMESAGHEKNTDTLASLSLEIDQLLSDLSEQFDGGRKRFAS